MDGSVRGMPLLSGPPPSREEPNSTTCRRCTKDLGFIFRSTKACQFCGFTYCSSCCDHQALMPRQSGEAGYEPASVCSYCIEYLTVTASSRNQLRSAPIAKLRGYLKAFNIPTTGALEKDDIVQAVLDARQPNGCLPPSNEDYYRRNSVPDQRRGRAEKRSFLDRAADAARQAFDVGGHGESSGSSNAPPAPAPSTRLRTPQQQNSRATSQPPPQSRPQPVPQRRAPASPPQQPRFSGGAPRSHPATGGFAPYQHPTSPQPQRTTSSNTPRPPPPRRPSTPIPSLSDLLPKTPEQLSALSVHVLKEILHQNHVNARLILEKEELVDRVKLLVENERRERERQAAVERMEEEAAVERQRMMMEEMRSREAPHTADGDAIQRQASPAPPPAVGTSPSNNAAGLMASLERQGLCVVCQDAEANMALVDCGHLALCKSCSDLIWTTSRECPLCRTRIITQERMLRIFKT